MKKLLILFLLVCSIASAQYGPIRFPSSGGGTFTGGTLTSDLVMDNAEIELSSGTSSNLSLRFKGVTSTGLYGSGNKIYFHMAGNGDTLTLADDQVQVNGALVLKGTTALVLAGTLTAGAAYAIGQAPTAINPVWSYWSDNGTGIGRQAYGKPSIISNGVECIRVASSGTQIFQPLTLIATQAVLARYAPVTVTDGSVTSLAPLHLCSGIITVKSTSSSAHTSIPFYGSGAGATTYSMTVLDPDTDWVVNSGLASFTFVAYSGGSPNTYAFFFDGTTASATIQRVGGSQDYTVSVTILPDRY